MAASSEETAERVAEIVLRMPQPEYCERFLKIRTKTEGIAPFRYNIGQLYLHRRAELQLRRLGYVRLYLLKARQWGGCLAPDTPVLTADLHWLPIGELRVGNELVACDEEPHRGSRKMRTSTVLRVWRTEKPSFRIVLDDGTSVVCSADHRWLSKKSQDDAEWRSIAGRARLKVGTWIRSVTDTWGDQTLDDAWLGGMIDGEGCLNARRKTGGSSLTIAQREGVVLDRMDSICENRGYEYAVLLNNRSRVEAGRDPVYVVNVSSARSLFKVLGLSRPERFIDERWWEGARLPNNGWRKIVAIEPGPTTKLIDIETSTGTYIANGLVSHNSTYIQSRQFTKIIRGGRGVRAFILTHQAAATSNIFSMTHRFMEHLPSWMQPDALISQKRITFPALDSSYAVATAGAKDIGHSDTVQLLHGSECALWPNADEHLKGVLQTVPPQGRGTEVFLESTGKGIGNAFQVGYANARAGLSEYETVFVPWIWFPKRMDGGYEYSAPVINLELSAADAEYMEFWGLDEEQMQFRQNKIVELGGGEGGTIAFATQYPTTPEEAFSSNIAGGYIASKYVLMARRRDPKLIATLGPKILGIDPSDGGHDRFVSILRQGRIATRVGRWTGLTTTQSFPRVVAIIDQWKPDIICVDIGGSGWLYDQLVEICRARRIILVAVLGGEQAEEPHIDRNIRTQNWRRMREWFEAPAGPCIIDLVPSFIGADAVIGEEQGLEEIQGDITNPLMDWDNQGRPVVETKKKVLTHAPSPDNGDALANTFVLRVGADWKPPPDYEYERTRRPINWRAV
jgi:hypothetical protein